MSVKYPSTVLRIATAAVAILLLGGRELRAVTLEVQGPAQAVEPGGSAEVCINMGGSGGRVAGVQLDLSWDPGCLTVNAAGDGAPLCRSNRATGKNVQSAMRGGSSLRAFFLSVSDTKAIPDTQLFCCTFTVVGSPGSRQCGINLSEALGGSTDRVSQQIPISNSSGVVYVAGDAGPGTGNGGTGGAPQRGAPQPPPAVSIPGGQLPAVQAPAPLGGGPSGGVNAPGAVPAARAPAGPGVPAVPAVEPREELPGEPAALGAPTAVLATRTAPRTPAAGTPTPKAKTPTPKAKGTTTASPAASAAVTGTAKTPTPKPKAE